MPYIGLLLFLAVIGTAVWWLLSSRQEPGSNRRGRGDAPRGPDDDPDFLRDLDRKYRP